MIERYSRPQMTALWSMEACYRTWLDIEILASEGWARIQGIPEASLKQIKNTVKLDIPLILEREKNTKHDIAAFVSVIQESVGEAGRYIHMGLTSSDILDTAFSYRLKSSATLLLKELDQLLLLTKERAIEHKYFIMIGRTHGIHAEPITMGLKWLQWHTLLARSKARLLLAKEEVSAGKLSGVVGTYAEVPPSVEEFVCEKLGLLPDTISTQVIARDRYASYFMALSLIAAVVETIAVEIRHLQRTEVQEVREGFGPKQKGSSAMPHKRNPIIAENLTGLSRLVRSLASSSLENCVLWHERDISHSSVERVIGPDINVTVDFMLARLLDLLTHLEVFPDKMRHNLDLLYGANYSQSVLLALVKKGMSRDSAYELVQKLALKAIDQKQFLLDLLQKETKITDLLSESELKPMFDPSNHLKNLDHIYEKALKQ